MNEEQISLNYIELVCLLRHARARRDMLWHELMALQERHRAEHNGGIDGAIRVMDSELDLLDGIIRKLWVPVRKRHR